MSKHTTRRLLTFTVIVFIIFALIAAAILGLSVAALTFGIIDIVNHGANTWAIVWIVLGGIGILSALFSGKARK